MFKERAFRTMCASRGNPAMRYSVLSISLYRPACRRAMGGTTHI